MTWRFAFTARSGNAKTGAIPVTMTERKSCPDCCPFKANNDCYPVHSRLGMQWQALSTDGMLNGKKRYHTCGWHDLLGSVSRLPAGQLWRHNTAGDLLGDGTTVDAERLHELVRANIGRRGFTYTHYPVGSLDIGLSNARAIYAANRQGFRINLSTDTLAQADWVANLRIGPVVVALPSDAPAATFTPEGRRVVVCLAQQSEGITCATCGLCYRWGQRAIIGFRAHGIHHKSVDRRLAPDWGAASRQCDDPNMY